MATKEISLTTGLPASRRSTAADIARRKAVADELLRQSIAPGGRMVIDTGKYLVPDIGGGIAKIGQALMGRKFAGETDADAQALSDAIQAQRQKETAAYLGTKFGGQDIGNAPVAGQEGPPTLAETKAAANPIAAIAQALQSDDPSIQAMGMEDMKHIPNPQDILKAAQTGKLTGEGLAAFQQNPANPAALTPMPEMALSDGVAVTHQGGRPIATTPVNQYSGPFLSPETGLPVERNLDTGKTHGLTAGNVTQPGQKGTDALDVELGKGFADEIKASKANLIQMKDMLPGLVQMPDLIRKTQTGAAADYIQLARRWGQLFGLPVDAEKITNYQLLQKELFPQMIAKLRQMGTGQSMSDKDAMRAIEAALASPTYDANAMIKAQGGIIALMMNKTAQHGQLLDILGRLPGGEKYVKSNAYYVDMPTFTPEMMAQFGIKETPQGFTVGLTDPIPNPPAAPVTAPTAPPKYTPDQIRKRKLLGLPI